MSKKIEFNVQQVPMYDLFTLVRNWANEKGIYDNGDIKTQVLKLVEETGELSKAVLNSNNLEIEDAIGDCLVVLINVAELHNKNLISKQIGYSYIEHDPTKQTAENCLLQAYNVISKRKGKMQNGTFIKDKK